MDGQKDGKNEIRRMVAISVSLNYSDERNNSSKLESQVVKK